MRPIRSGQTVVGTRRPWEPPALTRLAIGTETKFASDTRNGDGSQAAGSAQPSPAEPQPTTVPATKLGFAFEWSFPLSSRFEH